ncbi:tRNA (adenosine(37)-N6)-threonylcarbamoyltransferase complex dimerization subunit type 1 TsaB [Ornithinimicrobium pratense]|uniref:tRNA (Adenosine(37)-N6)-threonylcarbamoyltransferase complex dimerization subunit type 1 TsaB n=1 Tax=Ornithinimicrobium pratense TaxID=2593973 RepID=A0A5J6VA71_9MICO|nr:tRNA (adenosine(37)-N6)-threonylcarbamoyltransferase complex dimerization subunit type 1 TsaB [Ornithinimicrobium pratense]
MDTATHAIGAAVHDGRDVRARVVREDARKHAELLTPAIEEALRQAGLHRDQLTAVVCGVGPGPFTGLRVGVVTAQVLAHALGLPAPQGICSLDALAHAVRDRHQGELLVATDARRKEVYWARYRVDQGRATRVAGPGVARAADLPREVRELPVVGRGALLYPDALPHLLPDGPRDVDPGELADLAVRLRAGAHPDEDAALLPPEPLYLRRPDAVAPAGMPTSGEG